VYDFRESNIQNLVAKAGSKNWSVSQDVDVNAQWATLHDRIHELINETIPQQDVCITSRDKTWMTPLTKMMINEKWNAYRRRDWGRFNILKTKCKIEIAKAKSLWAEKMRNSTQGLWKLTKHLSGKAAQDNLQSLVTQCKTPAELAEKVAYNISNDSKIMDDVSDACHDAEGLQKEDLHRNQMRPPDNTWAFKITESDVKHCLSKLSPRKAMGCDRIPNRIYRILAPYIAGPLKNIYQTSLSQRKFPLDWKKAIVVPIPKTSPPLISKLRTISLLPAPAKILEKLVLQNIWKHLEPYIGRNQHAYRRNASISTALIEMVDILTLVFDNPIYTGFGVLNIDFSKAFDRVNHHVLLSRLSSICLGNGFLSWLNSYLTGRSFKVRIQGALSTSHVMHCGVPQGSVLGPALFSVLAGSLPYDQTLDHLVQYADDASFVLPFITRDPEVISQKIRAQLASIEEWCSQNKQTLNLEKSTLIVHMRKPLDLPEIPVRIVSSQKLLGVTLSFNLTWDNHIQAMYRKACQRLHILRVLKRYAHHEELHLVYQALIRSLFDYCCPLFVILPKKLVALIRRTEKRAHKIMFGVDSPCECTMDGLEERRKNMSMKLFSEILDNKNHLLHDRLPTSSNHSSRLSNFSCRTNRRLNSFFPQTTILYNSIH
jgi:hypothetical protein